jgi:hypothetical protein
MLKVLCPKGLQSQIDYATGYVDSAIYDYSLIFVALIDRIAGNDNTAVIL